MNRNQLDPELLQNVATTLMEKGYCSDEDGIGLNSTSIPLLVRKWAKLREYGYTGGQVKTLSGHAPNSGTVHLIFDAHKIQQPQAKKMLKRDFGVKF